MHPLKQLPTAHVACRVMAVKNMPVHPAMRGLIGVHAMITPKPFGKKSRRSYNHCLRLCNAANALRLCVACTTRPLLLVLLLLLLLLPRAGASCGYVYK
jgi:hypothetical protein